MKCKTYVTQGGLPLCGDFIGVLWVASWLTIFAIELGKSVLMERNLLVGERARQVGDSSLGEEKLTKVINQADIVAFHDNAGRDEHAPCDGLGIQLEALHQSHAALLVGSRTRAFNDGGMHL